MKIHEMRVVSVPLDRLTRHPLNANNGDIDALEESVEVNGFFSPLLVQRSTGYVIGGNHRLLVLARRGVEEAPVIYLDVDDEYAKRIMLADNRITRRGFDDEPMLVNLLADLYATDDGLHGTGYDVHQMELLIREMEQPYHIPPDEPVDTRPEQHAARMHVTVTPIVQQGQDDVFELVIEREGMGPISRTDVNLIRRALGLEPYSVEEIKAFDVPNWSRGIK